MEENINMSERYTVSYKRTDQETETRKSHGWPREWSQGCPRRSLVARGQAYEIAVSAPMDCYLCTFQYQTLTGITV